MIIHYILTSLVLLLIFIFSNVSSIYCFYKSACFLISPLAINKASFSDLRCIDLISSLMIFSITFSLWYYWIFWILSTVSFLSFLLRFSSSFFNLFYSSLCYCVICTLESNYCLLSSTYFFLCSSMVIIFFNTSSRYLFFSISC